MENFKGHILQTSKSFDEVVKLYTSKNELCKAWLEHIIIFDINIDYGKQFLSLLESEMSEQFLVYKDYENPIIKFNKSLTKLDYKDTNKIIEEVVKYCRKNGLKRGEGCNYKKALVRGCNYYVISEWNFDKKTKKIYKL